MRIRFLAVGLGCWSLGLVLVAVALLLGCRPPKEETRPALLLVACHEPSRVERVFAVSELSGSLTLYCSELRNVGSSPRIARAGR